VKLLIDEMYPASLAEALRADGVEAVSVVELGLAGRSDSDVFAAAVAGGHVLVTENVADFARIAADHLSAGHHQPGVLIALSSRFSRRRPTTATRAPLSRNARATARPMPLPPPVTSTTLPANA